jgi:polysaccharide pyruvyl transferase WcaK-like protein
MIAKRLTDEIYTKTFIVPPSIDARDAKRLVQRCHMLLTGRMHLAIAAISTTTKVACVEYKEKFEGLFKYHLDLQDCVISSEQAYRSQNLAAFALDCLDPEHARSPTQTALDRTRTLASNNIAPIPMAPRERALKEAAVSH